VLELIVGALAVVGTGVLGTAGVRLGMRPLDRVTRTARTVAAELGPDGRGLQNRVPDADPRTEVGQLAEAVNTMLGAVEREYATRYASEQRLRRFLADASHELRTPLTSLRGYAELVRMRGGLDPDAADSLRRIETEGKRMGGLVDDLLTLARSDRGVVVERTVVDLTAVVEDAAAGIRAAHPTRPVEVVDGRPLPGRRGPGVRHVRAGPGAGAALPVVGGAVRLGAPVVDLALRAAAVAELLRAVPRAAAAAAPQVVAAPAAIDADDRERGEQAHGDPRRECHPYEHAVTVPARSVTIGRTSPAARLQR